MFRWYVLQTKPGAEEVSEQALKKIGYRTLLPRAEIPTRSGGEWTLKPTILIPGYITVFVEYKAEDYYKIKKIDGILKFIGNGGTSYLSTSEAEYLKLLSGEVVEPSDVEKDGDSYKAVSGVLTRFPKDKVKINARDRKATISLCLCGEKKKVTVGINVTKAD